MSAIIDVARRAGVSKATASRALSGHGYVAESTRIRVEAAASELGYAPSATAVSLVTGRSKNVGVLIPFINRWFFGEVLEGIEGSLLAAGYDLTLYNLRPDDDSRERLFEFFLARKRVDALISVGVDLRPAEIARLHALAKPVVGIGGPIDGATTFAIDDVAAARLATEHLISLGHSRIAHIGGDQSNQMDFSVHEKRLRGFEEAMGAVGLRAAGVFRPSDFTLPGGHSAALQLLGDPRSRPTAVFAGSDEIAFGTIIAARDLGIDVPRDLSVIGIDGHEYSPMFALTTIEQDPLEQGALAVDAVMAALDEREGALPLVDTILPTRLVVRGTTSAPRPPAGG